MKTIDWKNIDMKNIKNSVGIMVQKVKSSDAYKRPLAIAIAAALIVSAAGAGTCSILSAHHTKTIQAMRAYVESADLQEQDETVYVIADADGGVKKVIVSDWQKDSSKNNTIADIKSLDELEKSDAENGYSINADTASSWDANGNAYQNVSTGSDLPIEVKLSYSLDGKKMTANEIAGKSGKVKIRFDYTNNQKQTVSIDGKDTDIYVPFTVVTGTILDGNTFKNVEVSNGKVINDGSRSVVMGFALPGMQESLGLDGETLDLPNYIEITADVTNFELTTTLTMVSNDFFNKAVNDAEEKKNDSSSNLSLDSLSSGINQLVDGSAALYDGTSQLLDKSSLLIDGVNQLAEGSQELQAGIITVESALQLICSNNAQLQSGADQLFDTLLGQTQTAIDKTAFSAALPKGGLTKTNYHDVLSGLLSQANTQLSNSSQNIAAGVAAAVEQQYRDYVANLLFGSPQSVAAAPKKELAPEILATPETVEDGEDSESPEPTPEVTTVPESSAVSEPTENHTAETPEPTDSAAAEPANTNPASSGSAVSGGSSITYADLSDKQKAQVDAYMEQVKNTDEYQAKVQQAVAAYASSEEVQNQLSAAKDGISSLELALAQLDAFKTFYDGIYQYTNGVQQVCDGTGQLSDGAAQLSKGLNDLQSGSDALVDGIKQLNNGAMQLSDGMQQLSGSNLAKLLGASSGVSLADVNARFDAMRDVSASYNSYTGNADSDGVKFIYRTDSVSAESSK